MIDPTERRMERLDRALGWERSLKEEARAEAEKWRTIAGDYTDTESFPWEAP